MSHTHSKKKYIYIYIPGARTRDGAMQCPARDTTPFPSPCCGCLRRDWAWQIFSNVKRLMHLVCLKWSHACGWVMSHVWMSQVTHIFVKQKRQTSNAFTSAIGCKFDVWRFCLTNMCVTWLIQTCDMTHPHAFDAIGCKLDIRPLTFSNVFTAYIALGVSLHLHLQSQSQSPIPISISNPNLNLQSQSQSQSQSPISISIPHLTLMRVFETHLFWHPMKLGEKHLENKMSGKTPLFSTSFSLEKRSFSLYLVYVFYILFTREEIFFTILSSFILHLFH